ncbi:MAG: lytic transglycosylase domain-containing protein [Lentisphaeria bacterium]|nr:lytic transglycosylase domain-containing protein [Lentisphaeria bacterium]
MPRRNGRLSLKKKTVLTVVCMAVPVVLILIAAGLQRGVFWVDDTKYGEEIGKAAARHGVDPQLVRAVIYQESRFRPEAVGDHGEVGLMQVLPSGAVADWARLHGRRVPSHASLMRVELNLEIGVWYLARALARWSAYRERIPLALIQYNAGEARAERWKPEKPDGDVVSRIRIGSTKTYVEKIVARYHRYIGKK